VAHQPYRPFESLEWYRDAARNNFRDDTANGKIARWARGFGMLHTHVCVFAVAIVLLLIINMLRSPGNIWADRWIMAWTVLILIHAVAVGILWAIQQWNTDLPDEPLHMGSANQWQQADMFAWGSAPAIEAQDVTFRVTESASSPDAAWVAEPPDAPAWAGWNANTGSEPAPDTERASWKEASAAAWLDRGPARPDAANDPEPEADR
jgi:hypothetical protein